MGWLRRIRHFFTQSDEERLAAEMRRWADAIPGTVRIGSCPSRQRVRVAGWVRRIGLRPMNGQMTLEAVIADGTGELTAAWTGRSHIPGLSLGTGVVLEGVVSTQRGGFRMVNPGFEFA